ncbi:MAG TPA: hypothetical protein VJ111_12995, partial [Chitinophagaceae bacterium]|nr:hypothetical protein [Chitinophagaceae bacterium]
MNHSLTAALRYIFLFGFFFLFLSSERAISQSNTVIPDFIIPDTICVNTQVNISNISMNATNYYWNFCVGNINQTPAGTNLGNPGGEL